MTIDLPRISKVLFEKVKRDSIMPPPPPEVTMFQGDALVARKRRAPLRGGETLNSVTPEQWRRATQKQREAFHRYWAERGVASFVCLTCGFPTVRGQASCEACE